MTSETRVEIVSVRTKEVPERVARQLVVYIGARGVIAKWVKVPGFSVEIPMIILDSGVVLYGSTVWWKRI